MKKIMSAILCIAMVISLITGISAYATSDIGIELDGKEITFDVKPQIVEGRVLVPLRKIFEEIGALVKWDNETKTVAARKSSKTVFLTIGSDEMQIDKGDTDSQGNPVLQTVTLDVPAQIADGRTLVPVRAVSESFGLDVKWDNENKKVIITSDNEKDNSWEENKGTVNLSDMTCTGNGIEIAGNQILITKGGDFTLSGTLLDGSIVVSSKDKVKLRLKGASITTSEGPCIFFEDADKAYITISEGTKNTLTAENSEDGAIYSKENLEIKGNGTLNVSSPAGHGIKASDNLVIENGNILINAANDGIHINETFNMSGGYVKVTAVGDGVDSESIVNISAGKIVVETNAVPIKEDTTTQNADNTMQNNRRPMMEESIGVEFEKSSKGINAEWMLCISGGELNINSASHTIHCADEMEITGGIFTLNSKYGKGISAHGNLTISNSDTVIDITKSTEGIEGKKTITINDGTIKIVSSDDGINATGGNSGMPMGGGMPQGTRPGRFNRDNNTMPPVEDATGLPQEPVADRADRWNRPDDNMMPPQMNGEGNMVPPEFDEDTMPEGGFMQRPDIDGDSMMPPMGGNFGGMGGRNMPECLIINGGDIEIFAKDDCLDANGKLVLNGGIVKAIKENGSFTGNNSVLDADGGLSLNEGATVVAAGNGGQQGSLALVQNCIIIYSEQSHTATDSIVLKDDSSDVIAQYTPGGNYSAVFITSPKIETGKTYTVLIGAQEHSVTIESQNTTVGTQKGGSFGGNGRMQQMQPTN